MSASALMIINLSITNELSIQLNDKYVSKDFRSHLECIEKKRFFLTKRQNIDSINGANENNISALLNFFWNKPLT